MKLLGLILMSSLLLVSCKDEPKKQDFDWDMDKSIQRNKHLTNYESARIKAYFDRLNQTYEVTASGVFYSLGEPGVGDSIEPGDLVEMEYTVTLLDGTYCYSSDSTGNHLFIVDKDHTESGVHQGVKLLKNGGTATFVLPSHLAHGLLGDDDKIPGNAEIITKVHVVNVTKKD